jgi:hypothetical protein
VTEIAKCVCGAEARIHQTNCENYYVTCNKDDVYCWEGPVCPSESEAVAAWNGVMRARPVLIEKRKDKFNSLFSFGPTAIGYTCGSRATFFRPPPDEQHFIDPCEPSNCRAWLIAKLTAAGFDVRTEGK